MEHEKHGCVWHFHGILRGDHMISPLWSTSELLVSDSVLGLTSDLQLRARNRRVSKCGMADASTSRVRGRSLFLRFLFIPFRQALYVYVYTIL